MKKKVELIEGSSYKVRSMFTKDDVLVSTGIFRGYTPLGEMSAICLELDENNSDGKKGSMRLIPSHMILALDIIKQKKKKEMKEEEEGRALFYG